MEAKTPLKIKIFMFGWCKQNAILSKDNLVRSKWQADDYCAFCSERVEHMFFRCAIWLDIFGV
jgi:hypothetical protein